MEIRTLDRKIVKNLDAKTLIEKATKDYTLFQTSYFLEKRNNDYIARNGDELIAFYSPSFLSPDRINDHIHDAIRYM